ncbi:MAG TPA: dihydrolipoamide acetyltransferase family protein [Pseudonocardiaceae bacterium]
MPELLRMPEVAANTPAAVLAGWSLPVGASFRAHDTIATVETDKAVVDVEAAHDGVLLAALVTEGTEVAIGAPIALLAGAGEQVTDLDAALSALGAQPSTSDNNGRVFASPLARRLAKEAGLPVELITGTGPNSRITKRDVDAALAHRDVTPVAEPSPVATPPLAAFTDLPHSRVRRAIAARLLESKQTAPHFYLRGTANVNALVRLRSELNQDHETHISLTDLVVKAVGQAHLRVPELNVIWMLDAVRSFSTVDIAVAVATEHGLVTPVVRSVDSLSISALSRTTRDLIERAHQGTLRQQEIDGGTITVTNLGMYGTEEFAAIINPPQAAILAVGAVRSEPVALDGHVVVGSVLRCTLSVDHRPVDGVTAARWMREFLGILENPVRILA